LHGINAERETMSATIDYETKRQISDIQSKIASLDARITRSSTFHRPGGLAARLALCAVLGHQQGCDPDQVAREHFGNDRDLDRLLVLKTAVSPANTTVATWAAELVQTITGDVADRLLPESVFAGLRRLGGLQYSLAGNVIRVPTWAPAASGMFVTEGAPIPVSSFTLGAITLRPKKAGNIIAITDELLYGSPADVEVALRAILSEALGLMIDNVLLGNTAATTAAPAGILNGLTPLTATTGGGTAAMLGDIKQLTAAIAPALKPVLITSPTQDGTLGMLQPNPQGWQMIIAPTLAAGTVIAVDAAAFASALGVPAFRASQNVTLHEENTTPLALGTGTQGSGVLAVPMRSAFQTDVTALRSIVPVDWALRRANAVAYLTGATW
jgi:HK97 family phage major capsid protein